MDWRILVVLLPIILAGSWAFYNIGRIAIEQARNFLNNREA